MLSVILPYALIFSLMAIGAIFFISSYDKLGNYSNFLETLEGFRALPQTITREAAVIILSGEILVIGIMIVCGRYLLLDFGLKIVFLLIFTVALASILIRKF